MRKYNFSGINSVQNQSAVAPIYTKKEETNTGGFIGGLGYLVEKLATGFTQSLEGIVDYTAGGFAKLFGADDWADEQFQNDWFGDWYSHPDEWYKPSEGWKVAGDVASGIGTSLPGMAATIGTAAATGGVGLLAGGLGAATAGLGAAGTSTKQAYQETGKLGGKEFLYGALSGAVEGSTEALTNALSLGGGAVIKNIGKAFGKEVTETVAKQSVIKGMLGAFGGEAFEEGLSEFINPYLTRLTYDKNAENATAQEIAYAALVGGLAGIVMEGANVAVDSGSSFARGQNLTTRGLDSEVMSLSSQIASFQNANATENEAFAAVADTYTKLSESLAATGGKITTAAQKKWLGDLQRANTSAVFTPMITRSAANIAANAEAIAERLAAYGYTDASGKKMQVTADEIRAGLDLNDKKSFSTALQNNTLLRSLAVADVAGQLTMDTAAFRDATLAGKNLATRADLLNFAENATAEEARAVSDALGIDNWETLTFDDFADKIATFLRDGGVKRYAEAKAAADRVFADTSEAAALPPAINLADGQSRKYTDGEREFAIARNGEEYRIYDYATRAESKPMSRADVNKALADEREARKHFAEVRENERRQAETKRNTEEIDTWARENVKGYKNISATNQTMVRHVIRAARAHGLPDADVKMYADVSAHAGIDITFSKKLCRVEGGYADGFWDPAKNRIVVNPEGKRSAEKLLLHELDHAVRSGIRKDGGTEIFADAVFGISTEAAQKITARYKNVESDVSKTELIWDEANAYFAETFFANKGVLESLTAKVPSLKERILGFFEGAKTDYAGTPKLEGAAKRYYKTYKKMFDEFAERNRGANAESAAGGASPSPTEEKKRFRITDDSLIKKYPRLNLNEDISDKDGVPAIRLEDGSVLTFTEPHVSFIQASGIDVEDIESGGWITAGEYEPTERSDTLRYKERMLAKKRMDEKRAAKKAEKRYALPEEYSYDNLVKKSDLLVIDLPDKIPLTEKGDIDKDAVLEAGRRNARKQKNPNNNETNTYVFVADIGIDVLLSKKGMQHGMARSAETALAVMRIGDILKNSVAVNELNGSGKRKTEMSYILLGACSDAENFYVVRSVVSKLQNDVTEIDIYQLGAVKGKKIEIPTSALGGTAVTEQSSLIPSESHIISIANFLEYVKSIPIATEIFSEDVAEKLGVERYKGTLSPDLRYALPMEDGSRMLGAKEMNEIIDEMMRDGDIATASDIANDAPVATKSKRQSRFTKKDAMTLIAKLPHTSSLGNSAYKRMLDQMYNGLKACNSMDEKIDYSRTFAEIFVDELMQTRENRPDLSEAIETSRKLGLGKGKLTFTQADIAELFHLLGEKDARAFMKKWGKQKNVQVKYPIDVFLSDMQTAAPEFTDAIDGKAPVDALIEIDRIYTDASERAKNKYIYPFAEMSETERAALEDKMFKAIMDGFAAADKEITAQAMKTVSDEVTLWQAKLEEQTATDRDFREAMQAEFEEKAENLAERERKTRAYYGSRMREAEAEAREAKEARQTAERAKHEAQVEAAVAKKERWDAELRADEAEEKAEARADRLIESAERKADRRAEAAEKRAEKAEERAKKARERTEAVKAELAESKKLLADRERGYALRASIGTRVQKLVDMKKGTFKNATTWGADNFKKILSTLSGVEWCKKFSAKKAIEAMQTMNEWYKPSNTLLGYIDNKNTGLYKPEIAGTIAELASLDEDTMMDTENLKSLDEVLGYFTKLIETHNKVFYRGKWVEAKPMAEGFISAAKQSGRALPGWAKAKMHGYLQTFGDTASVVRFYDGYVPSGFWTSMFDGMRESGIKAETEKARIMRDYEAFMKKNPKYLAEAEKATVSFMGAEMPKMEAVSLLMTMKREHAHKGLTASGFQYTTAKGETIHIGGFAPEAVRDPYAGLTIDERLAKEREEASAKDAEYRKTRDEARSKAAELRAEIKQAKEELAEYSTLQDTPDAVELKSTLEEYIETLEASREEQTRIATEYDTLLKDEKEKLRRFRETSKAERAKAMLDAVEAKRRELETKLTEADLEYIKILEAGYTECGNLKASRDLEKYGFSNVTGGYYYPIRRANTSGSIDIDFASELDRVSNASFNKDTVKGAAGKLFIQNADTLFRNHVKAVSQYYALSPAIDAYDMLYNMDVSGNPNDPTSVRTETQNTWKDGNEFMRDLMGDIQGVPRKRGKSAKAFDTMRGGYAKFQLGLNVKTWLGQFSSGFAAMSILDYGSTAKAVISGKKISRDVDAYCKLAELRNADNTAAMAQGASLPGRIYGKMSKFSDLMMAPMGWIDRMVVKNEFAVCQAQVAKNGGPAIGTEENRVEAGKLLEQVILETQQNTLATERSAAMRSGSEVLRTLTMFSADSMKVFGRVIDSFGEVAALKGRIADAEKSLLDAAGDDKEKRKKLAQMLAEAEKADKSKKTNAADTAETDPESESIATETETQDTTYAEIKKIMEMKKALTAAKRKKRKSVGALVASSIYMAFVAQFLRHLFDKEEDDDEVQTVLLAMGADTAGNLVGGLPIIRDIYSYIVDGFGVEDLSLSALNDLLSVAGQLISYGEKLFTGEVKTQDTMRLSRNALYSLSQTVGLPTRNLYNVTYGLTKRFSPETAYKVDEWFYEKNYQSDLYRALEDGDDAMAQMLLSLAVNENVSGVLTDEAHAELYRLSAAGYRVIPRAVGTTITVDGTEYAMGEEERDMVLAAYAGVYDELAKLITSDRYKGLTDEAKVTAIKHLYDTVYNAAISDVFELDRGNAALLASAVGADTMALLYTVTKNLESDKDESGKAIAGTKRKKTVAAINTLPVSTEKKLLLICSKGYTLRDGDVRGLSATAAKKRLAGYIASMPGKTKAQKEQIAEMCGFAVENGKISLKTGA